MVNQYGWTNVSVVEKDKGYYQVQEIYTNYLHENGGWHPRNAEALGVPEGRTVMYPDQVPGITKSEAGNYTNRLDTVYLVRDLAEVYGTYLTLKGINESPVYNQKISDNIYRGPRVPKADFTNKKGKSTLPRHVNDHGSDFGVTTEQEYLKQARNFLEKTPTPTTETFISPEGTYFRYDTATNEFGIINKFGGVSTYFKPDTKIDYWLKQIKDYAPK